MSIEQKQNPDETAQLLAENESIRRAAQLALRKGDFDFALRAVESGEGTIERLVENLRIYQAELEVQNEQLRQAQNVSNTAVQRFYKLFASLPLPALVIDEFGVISDCNESAEEQFNLNRKALHSHFFPHLLHSQEHARLRNGIEQAKYGGESVLTEVLMRPVNEAVFTADLHFSLLPNLVEATPHFAVIIVDQTQVLAQRAALEANVRRNSALLALTTHAPKLSDELLFQFALEQAEMLTNSQIAYLHFVDSEQQNVSYGAWSAKTSDLCTVQPKGKYLLSSMGVWVDSFRQRHAVIHNDYPPIAEKQDLPNGDVKLTRHLSVPVFEANKVVMIFGIGNKDEKYDASDVALVEMVANNMWVLLQRNRAQRKLELDANVFHVSREGLLITDAQLKMVSVNHAFTQITGYSEQEALGRNPSLLKSGKQTPEFYQTMWAQIKGLGYWHGQIWNKRKNGELYPQWLSITEIKAANGQVSEYIGIFLDVSENWLASERIQQLVYYDSLTALASRALLVDRAQQAIALAHHHATQVGLLMLDLDRFKDINDRLGHPVGDELLIQVAQRLLVCVRESDTVCRLGGDEFVVLLSEISSGANMVEVTQKIISRLTEPFQIKEHVISISASVGACIYPQDGDNLVTLMQRAETAMYQAKADGRNNYQFITDEMNQRVQQRLKLQADLHRALSEHEFFVEYQPQFELETGRIIGAEALVRWRHPELGVIPPAQFIELTEETGLIIELGQFVLQQAAAQAKSWLDQGYPLLMAVNVSAVQFARPGLINLISQTLAQTQLPASLLDLELTESILVVDPEKMLLIINNLKETGVFLSIDDFGTGYSSLSYLKRFAVHKLKIDQSFVRDILLDKDDAAIVLAIISLAKSLGMECIAEGVETEAQAQFLQQMGCQQIQGYWRGRPVSVEKFDLLLAQNQSESAQNNKD